MVGSSLMSAPSRTSRHSSRRAPVLVIALSELADMFALQKEITAFAKKAMADGTDAAFDIVLRQVDLQFQSETSDGRAALQHLRASIVGLRENSRRLAARHGVSLEVG